MSDESRALDDATGNAWRVADWVKEGDGTSEMVCGGVVEAASLEGASALREGEELTRVRRLGFCEAAERLDEGV